MKKASAKKNKDALRSEYDLSKLKGGVRGKYYREATAGTNLVLIEPELTAVFPDTESVNRHSAFLPTPHSLLQQEKQLDENPQTAASNVVHKK